MKTTSRIAELAEDRQRAVVLGMPALVGCLDSLSLRSRAYQVLYALGETSSTVRTLTDGEAACLVGIVHDMLHEDSEWNDLQVAIGSAMSPRMLEYVASGSMR